MYTMYVDVHCIIHKIHIITFMYTDYIHTFLSLFRNQEKNNKYVRIFARSTSTGKC